MELNSFFMLVLSDIHLGHNINKTENIIGNLRKFFATYHSTIVKAKIIVITGDTYDRLLSTNGVDLQLSLQWLTELVIYCKENNIILRVLEGTPSHDWKQLRILYKIIDNLNLDINFKYVEDVEIEYIEELNVNVLYVPDEIKPTVKEIYEYVLYKLKEKNLKTVEIALMHGAFDYQLPDFIDEVHNPKDYLKIVTGLILIGHIHDRSKYDIILGPGSFEALTHGEKKSKGGLLIEYRSDNTFKHTFLLNKYALLFKRLDVRGKSLEEVKKLIVKFNDHTTKLKNNISLYIDKDSSIPKNILELRNLFPFVRLTIKKDKVDKVDETINTHVDSVKTITLDKDSIFKHINNRLDTENNIELKDSVIRELEFLL